MTSGFSQNINTILAVLTVCLVLYYLFFIRHNDNYPAPDSGNVKDKDSSKKVGDSSKKVDRIEKEVSDSSKEVDRIAKEVDRFTTTQQKLKITTDNHAYALGVLQPTVHALLG